MRSLVSTVNNTVITVYLKVAKRVDLESPHHKKNECYDYVMILTRLTVVIVL